MKKMMILLIAAMAFVMVGCFGEDGTSIKWTNDAGSANKITDIIWVNNANDEQDTTWGEVLLTGETGSEKSVDALNGYAECSLWSDGENDYLVSLDDGVTFSIEINEEVGATDLTEGQLNELTLTVGAK